MKKVLGICAVVLAGMMIFASCGKKCVCTTYKNGKKVAVETSDNVRYFDNSYCTSRSEVGGDWELKCK